MPHPTNPGHRSHGHRDRGKSSPTYTSWQAMKQRCQYPKSKDYPAYGGAGVTVCERWQSFENFLADMGVKPAGMSIDRFPDKNGNYEPGNCRWADADSQTSSRRVTLRIEFEGQQLTIREISTATGAPYPFLYRRWRKGIAIADAIAEFRAR